METESIGRAEFDTIFEQYKDVVIQSAALCTRNQHTAEDIAQEVFLRFYIYIGHTKVDNAKSWLMTTAKNMAYNYVRDHFRETLIDVDAEVEELFGSIEGPESVFFEKLWNWETYECANTILDGLQRKNARWYHAVTLVYCMEKPQNEAAKCMGLSVDALQSMLYRAKRWIKRHYRKEFDYVDDM